jgi:xanthine/uracil permease
VSTSLIVCGILSSVQITRFHIYKTPYYIGTGLISVVGTSFATIPVATGAGKYLPSKVFAVVQS